ncbi:hypothetical protein BKI52_14020 [marine bacterium AO1-C]|nr:hypothetical protein BKI52_14020 [marine bacterium AO1-C]
MNHFFKTLTLLVWAGISVSLAQGVQTQKIAVYFAYKDASVSNRAQAQLRQFVQPILNQKNIQYRLTLTGVADSVGTNANNYDLAKQRAHQVQSYLTKLGLDSAHITLDVLGELPANSAQEHSKNRRVEVILSWGFNKASTPTQPTNAEDDISDLFIKLQSPPQVFRIDNTKDTILVGKKGTKILIKAHSFYVKKYQQSQPIVIHLKEYYAYSDMILANLTTTSNHRLLETGGMLYIKATQNGKEIRPHPRKNLIIRFPANRVLPNMRAYYGFRDKKEHINWRLNKRGWVSPQGALDERICWLLRVFSRKLRKRHRKLRKERSEAANLLAKKAAGLMEQGKNAYIMSTPWLSNYINCDAPLRMRRRMLNNMQVKTNYSTKNTRYFIMLSDRISLLRGYAIHKPQHHQQWLRFGLLPRGDAATLIVIRYLNKKAWIATHAFKVGKKIPLKFSFIPYKSQDTKKALEEITQKPLSLRNAGK